LAIFIPEEKILEIKNAANIVDIVSEIVHLKKTGKNFVGLCPFHSEKTPSFTVSPEKQIFYCFGCGAGGNVFSFLMKNQGLGFPEAARSLANRYGIEIPTRNLTPEQKRQIDQREILLQMNRLAMDFFKQALHRKPSGQAAMDYLTKRGLSGSIIDRFNVGYAPKGWDNLLNFFSKKGLSPGQLEKAGLLLPKKDGRGYYDRFRDRVIFPIIDVNQSVIGFGGRVMDDSLPKYLNSPETAVYNKSRSLYGLHLAKDKCASANTVHIVEGYLDLITLHQYGIENAVATLGTALTADHVRILSRYVPRMILVYDSDEAGIRSALRCIDIFWKEHVDFSRGDVFREDKADTHILVLPKGHDPDSYLRKEGAASFCQAAERAPGIVTFLIEQSISKHGLSTEGKIKIVADLQRPLAAINDTVARSLYVKQLAERIGIEENIVLEKVREQAAAKENYGPRFREDDENQKGSRLEQQVIAMMLQFPAILAEIKKYDVIEYIENKHLKVIAQTALEHHISSVEQISELLEAIENPEQKRLITALAMIEESWDESGCLKLIHQFIKSRDRLRDGRILEQIKAAERKNDQDALDRLLKEKQKMAIRRQKQRLA
jgi:DNA primase